MPMPVIYVAGPYRGPSREAIELNIQVARKVGALAARKGWSPIIPHANTGHLDVIVPDCSEQFWLDATLELMRRCDALVLCPGWKLSSGTCAEIDEARRLGMPIYVSDHELPLGATFVAERRGTVVVPDRHAMARAAYERGEVPTLDRMIEDANRFAPGGSFND